MPGPYSAKVKTPLIGAVDGDPLAIKRRLLKHEGYRFGA
jgi:hypothetical protein